MSDFLRIHAGQRFSLGIACTASVLGILFLSSGLFGQSNTSESKDTTPRGTVVLAVTNDLTNKVLQYCGRNRDVASIEALGFVERPMGDRWVVVIQKQAYVSRAFQSVDAVLRFLDAKGGHTIESIGALDQDMKRALYDVLIRSPYVTPTVTAYAREPDAKIGLSPFLKVSVTVDGRTVPVQVEIGGGPEFSERLCSQAFTIGELERKARSDPGLLAQDEDARANATDSKLEIYVLMNAGSMELRNRKSSEALEVLGRLTAEARRERERLQVRNLQAYLERNGGAAKYPPRAGSKLGDLDPGLQEELRRAFLAQYASHGFGSTSEADRFLSDGAIRIDETSVLVSMGMVTRIGQGGSRHVRSFSLNTIRY